MADRNTILKNAHSLKLGLFGANCSSGRSYITAPERWDTTWDNNVRLAQMADEVGLECMVPIARWKGYGGELDPNGTSWESITWACGLLAATKHINVFATVHVPLNHPVVAAKQMVTADHIGRGRFGVNVVCGWNDDEFQMFGVTKKEHEDRYEQGAEWWTIITKIWAGEGPFDFAGKHYRLQGVEGSPLPYGGKAPMMMNAGSSPSGRAFALRYSDMHFDGVRSPGEAAGRIAETKRLAHAAGREVQTWTPIGVICRPTRREAEEFMRHIIEYADRGAIGNLADMHRRDGREPVDVEALRQAQGERDSASPLMVSLSNHQGELSRIPTESVEADPPLGEGPIERRVLARGAFCAIGDPDWVAGQIVRLRDAGFDGLVLNFVNYLDEFPYFAQEVLPRLERAAVRQRPAASGQVYPGNEERSGAQS